MITQITDYNFNSFARFVTHQIYFEGADGFFLHMSTLELSWIRVFVGLIAYCCYHQFLAKICEKSFSIQVCSCKPLATGHRGQWAKLSGQTAKGALFSARFACFALLLTAGFSADARPCARCNWLPGKSLLESPELEDHTSFCPLSHLQAFWRLFFEHFATLSARFFWGLSACFTSLEHEAHDFFVFFVAVSAFCGSKNHSDRRFGLEPGKYWMKPRAKVRFCEAFRCCENVLYISKPPKKIHSWF